MSTAKAAVFDLGNVLLNWDPEGYYDARIGEDRRRAFFAEVPIDAMNARSDLGEDLEDLVQELASSHPDWDTEIRIWWTDWIKICAPAIEGSVRILERLKHLGVPVFSLTNFGDRTFDMARAAYPFLNQFDQHFVSARLRVMKPDPGIYDALEQATGFSGSDLIFADDRADNIAAARARGWQAHHFQTPEGWESALVTAGLLGS